MKKLITTAIIAACSLTYAIDPSLEADINEFIKLHSYMHCFFVKMEDREKAINLDYQCSEEFHHESLKQHTVVSEMEESLNAYVKENYKNLSFDFLASLFQDDRNEHVMIGCVEGRKDAASSVIKDFTAYSKAYNRIIEIKSKHPEVFDKNLGERCGMSSKHDEL